jgi:hypothetical protein
MAPPCDSQALPNRGPSLFTVVFNGPPSVSQTLLNRGPSLFFCRLHWPTLSSARLYQKMPKSFLLSPSMAPLSSARIYLKEAQVFFTVVFTAPPLSSAKLYLKEAKVFLYCGLNCNPLQPSARLYLTVTQREIRKVDIRRRIWEKGKVKPNKTTAKKRGPLPFYTFYLFTVAKKCAQNVNF